MSPTTQLIQAATALGLGDSELERILAVVLLAKVLLNGGHTFGKGVIMVRYSALTATALVASFLGACSSDSSGDAADVSVVHSALTSTVTSSGVTATLTTSSDWGTGYCADVALKNTSSTAVSSWQLLVNLNGSTVYQIWSATYSVSSGKMTVTPQAFNKSIPANGSVSFGYCANAPGSSNRPSLASLTVVGGGPGGTGGASSTGGAPATGGTTTTGGTTALQCGLPTAGTPGVAKPSGTAGNLKVLNWAGLKAAVSYTFDDGNQSQISNYSTLQALGVPFTFYLVTGWANASNAIWAQAVKDGHELGNHTQSHLSAGSGTDVDAATAFIQSKFGVHTWTMAAPNGDQSWTPIAATRFLLNRGVSDALIAANDNTNPFYVPTYIPPTGAATSVLNSKALAAQTAGKWQTMLVHGFTGDSSAYQPIALSSFTAHVNYAKSLGNLWLDTMTNVGAYWRGQKLVAGVTPTTSGTSKIYNWTLPANFPPGKCLRVTVDGGTLKQNGAALAWNTRGYYEVSLDAGSVTLSP